MKKKKAISAGQMKLEDISILAWIQEHGMLTETGEPLDFRDHLFLFDIYKDESPKIVCKKAAQIGFSTLAILKTVWLCAKKKIDIIYTLPSSADVNEFAGGKVNRIVSNNPILREYIKDKDSVELKKVLNNVIYYRGTWTERSAIMVSADLLCVDEEDVSKQDIISQYSSRLQHSKYKWEWHFSNPSVQGNGVSKYWAFSDQKEWFITCKCGKEQFLSWPESIDKKKRIYVCKFCSKELTREDRRVGVWKPTSEHKEYSGYHISLLMAPWVSADEILKYFETKSQEYFFNFILGEPYIGEGNIVTPDMVFRNLTGKINSQENVVIGCDSGLTKHFVLGNREGLFYYGKTESWEDIESFLKRYEKSIAVIDALPDLTEPRKLKERYPGRVYLCNYAKDRKTLQFIRWGKNEEFGNVVVDRNRTMQLLIDQFADSRIPLQGTQDDWGEYWSHFKTMYRLTTLNTLGVPEFKWETSTGEDHWCFVEGTKVVTSRGEKRIEFVKEGDRVLTRKGFYRVKKAMSRLAQVWDFGVLKGTADHPVWTQKEGFKPLHAVLYDDKITAWNRNRLFTKALFFADTLAQKTERSAFTLSQAGFLNQKGLAGFTKKSIRTILAIFLTVLWFTTRILTRLTTCQKTWKSCQEENISLYTLKDGLAIRKTGRNLWFILKESGRKVLNLSGFGGILQRVRGLFATMRIKLLFSSIPKSLFAYNVAITESPGQDREGNSAVSHAAEYGTREHGEQSIQNTAESMVYNLEVEGEHEYFANGILVSNCHATLYWLVGMDKYRGAGAILSPQAVSFPGSPEISPDQTMPGIDVKKQFVFESPAEDWRNA